MMEINEDIGMSHYNVSKKRILPICIYMLKFAKTYEILSATLEPTYKSFDFFLIARIDQVSKDIFDEMEEAYTVETKHRPNAEFDRSIVGNFDMFRSIVNFFYKGQYNALISSFSRLRFNRIYMEMVLSNSPWWTQSPRFDRWPKILTSVTRI